MKRYNFSLVELLVVIGIIGLLVGLLMPAIISGKTKGMITQAKADMNAIKMALKGAETSYQRVIKPNSSGSAFEFNGKQVTAKTQTVDGNAIQQLVLGNDNFDGTNSNSVAAYNEFIRELSVPQEITTAANKNFNVRNIKLLDPRPDYDKNNADTMWRDPWGNPYVVMINTNFTDKVYVPLDSGKILSGATKPGNIYGNNLLLSGNVFVYSFGPNGEDDSSLNPNNIGIRSTDDICSWEK